MSDILSKIISDKYKNGKVAIFTDYDNCKMIAREYGKENEFHTLERCAGIKIPHVCTIIIEENTEVILVGTNSDKIGKDRIYIFQIKNKLDNMYGNII